VKSLILHNNLTNNKLAHNFYKHKRQFLNFDFYANIELRAGHVDGGRHNNFRLTVAIIEFRLEQLREELQKASTEIAEGLTHKGEPALMRRKKRWRSLASSFKMPTNQR
jgi:hypothetical protein